MDVPTFQRLTNNAADIFLPVTPISVLAISSFGIGSPAPGENDKNKELVVYGYSAQPTVFGEGAREFVPGHSPDERQSWKLPRLPFPREHSRYSPLRREEGAAIANNLATWADVLDRSYISAAFVKLRCLS